MTPEQLIFGFMGAIGLYLLNSIRQEMRDLWQALSHHLQDKHLHTHCGKEVES